MCPTTKGEPMTDTAEKFKKMAGSHKAVAEYLGINARTYQSWRVGKGKRTLHLETYLDAMLSRYAEEHGFTIKRDNHGSH
jgi:hypothetical protein